jgi:hypothetical protein
MRENLSYQPSNQSIQRQMIAGSNGQQMSLTDRPTDRLLLMAITRRVTNQLN